MALLGVALVVLAVASLLVRKPASAGGVTRSVEGVDGAIALTFDDGPDPRFTPHVLDILADHDGKATFFVVGERAAQHPELIERMVAEGHEVAHHTHTHRHVEKLEPERVELEFDACLSTLEEQGVSPSWYRPPRKRLTTTQTVLATERGMRIALWTRTMERSRFADSDEMATVLVEETRSGDIVLAHDGGLDRSMTLEALPAFLDGMSERDLAVVTLSELEELRPRR